MTSTSGRRRPLNPDWPAAFLAALARVGCASFAAKAAGVGRRTAYDRRDRDPDFALAWLDAVAEAEGTLHAEAYRRAVEGVERPVFHKGEVVGHTRDFSDTLLIFLLKAANPGKYKDHVRHEHAGPGGGPVRVATAVVPAADAWAAERVQARLAELCVEGGAG